ncbi:MAG: preprotein translocase subunit SecG [Anaerotignaceae bacterium]
MGSISLVLAVVVAIIAIGLIVIVLLQSDRAAGLGAVGGSGSANNDSYWSKNKSSSMEGALSRYTKIGGALFMIIALVLNYLG